MRHRRPTPGAARSRRLRCRPLALALLAVASLIAAGCGGDDEPTALAGLVRDPAPMVAGVSLPDVTQGGAPLAFKAPPGELLLVYFGYLSCPDVCPTTMGDIKLALARLGDDAAKVSVAMATVDPARDTPENLTAYVRTFVPDGHALRTTDPAALRTAADPLGVSYEVRTTVEGRVEVDHSAFVYIVDDEGRLLLQWPFGVKSLDMARDLQTLLRAQQQ